MGTNVFETASLDLDIKYNNPINAVVITVLNNDTTAYDYTNKTDSNILIYDYKSGTLLKTIPEHATSGISYVSNVITWNDPWVDVNLAVGSYYYTIPYTDSVLISDVIPVDGILTVE